MAGSPPHNQKELSARLKTPQCVSMLLSFLGLDAGPVVRIEEIQTHSAYVFLIDDAYALKLERDVCYPFMDMSTLPKRYMAAQKEFSLNSRSTPELYLSVAGVRLINDAPGLEFCEASPDVECVIVMRQFRQEDLLSSLCDRGLLSCEIVEDLIDHVAEFHSKTEQCVGTPFSDSMTWICRDNAAELLEYAKDSSVSCERVEVVVRLQSSALAAAQPHMAMRQARGCVRHCHGDLHLKNAALIDGKPMLFDCIEFNDDLAIIDVLYDVSFLLMDLLYRGCHELANRAMNRYFDMIGSCDGIALLKFYVSVRATIRAKIACAEAALLTQSTPDNAKKYAALKNTASGYLSLAESVLAPSEHSMPVLAIGGCSGTGKSTLACALAWRFPHSLGAVHLRTDVLRKQLPALSEGEHEYSEERRATCYRLMADTASKIAGEGWPVVLDATFSSRAMRALIPELLMPVRTVGVWLTLPLDVAIARVEARDASQRADWSQMTAPLLRANPQAVMGGLEDEERVIWHEIDASGAPQDVLGTTIDLLAKLDFHMRSQ